MPLGGRAGRFIDNLLMTAAAEPDGPVIVLSSPCGPIFMPTAPAMPGCAMPWRRQQEYIGAMNDEELRRAIEEPARRGRWELEPGLVDLLLHDVGHEPGHCRCSRMRCSRPGSAGAGA